jgi:DNA-binding transcriptional LysR family regulator
MAGVTGARRREARARPSSALTAIVGRTRARILVALDEPLSTTEVAAAASIAVSTASEHLTALARAGLLEHARFGRSVKYALSDRGRLMLSVSGDFVSAPDASAAADRLDAVQLGVFQTVGSRLLPELVVRLREHEPPIGVDVVEELTDRGLLAAVARGSVDAAFAMLPLPEGPFSSIEILRERFVLLARADSALAKTGSIDVKALSKLPLIVARNCRAGRAAEATVATLAGRLRVAFRSDDNTTIHALVVAGVGTALVPRLLVDDFDSRVGVVELEGTVPVRRLGLAWHSSRTLGDPLALVAGLSDQVARNLTADVSGAAVAHVAAG